jgi:hypothetical protein
MVGVTPNRKIALTVLMFVLGTAAVLGAAMAKSYVPLFFGWIPLIAVSWILTRPEPGTATDSPGSVQQAESAEAAESLPGEPASPA